VACVFVVGCVSRALAQIGHSLGGGVAAELGVVLPDLNVCAERTFSSVAAVAPFFVLPRAWANRVCSETRVAADAGSPPPSWLERGWTVTLFVLVLAVKLAVKLVQWDINAAWSWKYIHGRKWITHHPRDNIIPVPAQLQVELRRQQWFSEALPTETIYEVRGRLLRLVCVLLCSCMGNQMCDTVL